MKPSFKPSFNCPCKNKNTRIFYKYNKKPNGETDFKIKKDNYLRHYYQCKICKHMFSSHKINLSEIYNGEYVDATYDGVQGMKKRFDYVMKLPFEKSDNKQRVKRILDFIQPLTTDKNYLLDFGAGIGVFAKCFQLKKWNVETIETDKRTIEYLKKIGINSSSKYNTKINAFKNKFHLITFNKVLEHIEKPILILRTSKKFLKKNGIIYVELPDVSASKIGKNREEFFIDHHHVFSITSASIMLQVAGFKVLHCSSIIEPSGKYTIIAFCSV